jgi:YfiH family protein
VATHRLNVFRFHHLSELGVPHGMTRREPSLPSDGDVSFATAGSPAEARLNRQRWWHAIGLDWRRTVCGRQVHGARVALVSECEAGRGADGPDTALPATDGLVTADPGLPLAIFCADCAPVLLYDPVHRVAAALHAGWRGTVAGIVLEAVNLLITEFGTDPAQLRAGIGPAIGPCCYEVGDEVIESWLSRQLDREHRAVIRCDGRWHFNLWEANLLALELAGVPPANVELAGICTRCRSGEWFSHRAYQAGHIRAGRFAAVIAVPAGGG